MPQKPYPIAWCLEQMQPASKFRVTDNDTDRIRFIQWSGSEPTEAEIDAMGATYVAADENAKQDISRDRLNRVLFEINFDQEQRLRVLESQPAITKAQYRNALVNLYKSVT